MPPLSPYAFRDEDEIVEKLTEHKTRIDSYFGNLAESLEEIALYGVAGNTFRAFRNLPKRPSAVYKDWSRKEIGKPDFVSRLTAIESSEEYDGWISNLSDGLKRHWKNEMGENIQYGASRKLPNLLMKGLISWAGFTSNQRNRLIKYLHVPLDSYTLVGITNCIDLEIPSNATMKFVAGESMYMEIQAAIKKVCLKAKVPAIYFDVLCWNLAH